MTLKFDFFQLMNDRVFGKTVEEIRRLIDTKLVTTNEKKCYLASEHNYHTTKCSSENLLAIEMKKMKLKMNKPSYLLLSILETGETLIYDFSYDYIKFIIIYINLLIFKTTTI